MPIIALVKGDSRVGVGDRIRLDVVVIGVRELVSAPMTVEFDAEALELDSVEIGPDWPGPVEPTLLSHSPRPGRLLIGLSLLGEDREGITGSGRILRLHFRALAPGTTEVGFDRHALLAPELVDLGARAVPASVSIKP